MRRLTNVWSIMGLVILAIGASHLAPSLIGEGENRWTPRGLAVPLPESSGRIEILVQDRLLDELIRNRAVLLAGQEGRSEAIRAQDVKIVFNERESARAAAFRFALIDVMGSTAGLMLILFGVLIFPRIARPAPPKPQAATPPPPSRPPPPGSTARTA